MTPRGKEKSVGREFWSSGYFLKTVSKFGDENTISKYAREQGVEKEYELLHKFKQLKLRLF